MSKRPPSPRIDEDGQSAKLRRTARACLQCRARKQRCLSLSDTGNSHSACKRCRQLEVPCSFETEPVHGPDVVPSPLQMSQLVVLLQTRLVAHDARISELERRASGAQMMTEITNKCSPEHQDNQVISVGTQDARSIDTTSLQSMVSPSHGFTMDKLDLGPPIATLRSLGALGNREHAVAAQASSCRSRSDVDSFPELDPITKGVLSIHEAQRAVNMFGQTYQRSGSFSDSDRFFEHCHPLAPLLGNWLGHSASDIRAMSSILFLAICSIGTRFWEDGNQHSSAQVHGLHPKYHDLIALLDAAISRLLLRPSTSDVTIESIQVLLLYAQWMPCGQAGNEPTNSIPPQPHRPPKSRYNDISAWAILGLAGRYASVLDLDRVATTPFQRMDHSISTKDASRMRTLINLLTCDYNLMLNSGLAASISPASAASVGHVFGSHPSAQQPADLRVTALVELVLIAQRATVSSSRQLDAVSLRRANAEFDDWERTWYARLRHTDSQHNQLPFNSVRWYRLALNSASLRPLLSSVAQPGQQPIQVWRLQCLETSLTAAAQTLISLSTFASDHVWTVDSQNTASFPNSPYFADTAALTRLYYAVDSTWISHTFAVAFLVLCYVRGTIDDDLRICSLNPASSLQTCAPISPRSDSIVARLVRLATDIFDGVCRDRVSHPARDFQTIVHNAASLVLPTIDGYTQVGDEADVSATEYLLNLMNESGLEWPGNLFDADANLDTNWGYEALMNA